MHSSIDDISLMGRAKGIGEEEDSRDTGLAPGGNERGRVEGSVASVGVSAGRLVARATVRAAAVDGESSRCGGHGIVDGTVPAVPG